MLDSSDFELLDRWKAGDREAGHTLFERHFEGLYRFFRNKVDDNVDDLVQQTLLACVEAQPRFRREAEFRTFLFGVARFKLYEHYRRQKRKPDATPLSELSVEALGTSPSVAVARRGEQMILLRALRRLPLDMQIALELAYWEGLDAASIGQVLEIPRERVYQRMHQARALLRKDVHRLARTPATRASTETDLDRWASSLRAAMGGKP